MQGEKIGLLLLLFSPRERESESEFFSLREGAGSRSSAEGGGQASEDSDPKKTGRSKLKGSGFWWCWWCSARATPRRRAAAE